MPHPARRNSREAALVELQRLHAAIQASRAKRGVPIDAGEAPAARLTPEAHATRELRRRLQAAGGPAPGATDDDRSRRVWLGLAAAAVLAGAGLWAVMTFGGRGSGVVVDPVPPVTNPSPPPAAPAPAASAPAEAAVTPARPVRVTLDTIRPVWLRVMADGATAIEREVPAGEHLAFEGDTRVVVRAGDGGGVRASLNGEDRGPLGKDGWPITVPFVADGADTARSPAPATPAATEPTRAPAAPARAVRVTLDTIRPVWLRVIVDGTSALEREIAAGEHLAFEGGTRIVVRAGDGGGVRASLNGIDRGILGTDGRPITVPFAVEPTSPPPE